MGSKKLSVIVSPAVRGKLSGLISIKRLHHSVKTTEISILLAKKFRSNIRKAAIAGILHDCAKDLSRKKLRAIFRKNKIKPDAVTEKNPALWHCLAGPIIARKEFGVRDREILDAIRFHTIGKKGMGKTAKILYVADYSEFAREYKPSKKIRAMINKKGITLDELVCGVVSEKLIYLIRTDKLIHPDAIELWNSLNG